MLEALISSKTRIKILLKFFLNPESASYLRSLEAEFGESTNAIRLELNRFEKTGMLSSDTKGNRKIFKARTDHPLFDSIRKIVMSHTGIDRIINNVIERLGDVDRVFLTGKLAQGLNSPIIDLVFVGNPDRTYLLNLIEKAEKLINRKVKYLVYSPSEAEEMEFDPKEYLLIWDSKKN